MKSCELCKLPARTYCESDDASLCWPCDAKVHGANFLVARHSRTLLCQFCQSPTPWKAAGARLGHTVSFCFRCADGDTTNESRRGGVELEEESGSEEEDEDEDEGEEEDGDNQVVPWSSSASTPPPPDSDSDDDAGGGEFVQSRRSCQTSLPDLRYFPQDDASRRSCRQGYGQSHPARFCSGAAASVDCSPRPLKNRRMEAVDGGGSSENCGRPI